MIIPRCMSSWRHDANIAYLASMVGGPRYIWRSNLSLKAASMDDTMFDVDRISTFFRLRRESSDVSTALTTRTASPGSLLFKDELRAPVIDSTSSIRTMTNVSSSDAVSEICSKSFITSFPDSENHFENSE